MKAISKLILIFSFFLSNLGSAVENLEGDIHKNDFTWLQFNIFKSINDKIPFGRKQDVFLEMEFGGRSGVFDLYGFLDVLDILDSKESDSHNGDNFFLKVAPRISLDTLTNSNLAVGPFKEWYISLLVTAADRDLFQQYIGIGTNIEVPWLGKIGANLMGRYIRENYGAANEDQWDGYLLAINWFKPFYTFTNDSKMVYQGYLDYTFAANKISDSVDRTDNSLAWFNGLFWQSSRYAAGYGLKYYKDTALFKSGGIAGETTGFAHYLILTYKY